MPGQFGFVVVALLTNVVGQLDAETIVAEKRDDDFYFNMPRGYHEFTVEVGPLREDCFYQHVAKGMDLFLSFEVLRGGDSKIDFIVRDPNFQILENVYLQSDGSVHKKAVIEGVYSVCLDNTFSRFSSKLVVVVLIASKYEDWDQYTANIEELKEVATLLKTSLEGVESLISEVRRHQNRASSNVLRDWYLVTGNNRYVSYYSVTQCVVIVISACIQIYVLRRFFRTVSVTPSSKPRA
ncbi:transmembrane emp24 domain-containing protein 5-like [Gigantopelta aegis]|uniref:transmembrane emp24 domain-containing protein 5-like n=1 Tax=Gigantopelta aegis TaxID=1735272 RepID=UPI001B88A15E|nr:transmembrane emp24 domain-containing protein 5-like [Gigantopelta aegis]